MEEIEIATSYLVEKTPGVLNSVSRVFLSLNPEIILVRYSDGCVRSPLLV